MSAHDDASAQTFPRRDAKPPPRKHRAGRTAHDPFGEVLPDRTRDEEAAAWGEHGYDDEDRLRREVPPHHG